MRKVANGARLFFVRSGEESLARVHLVDSSNRLMQRQPLVLYEPLCGRNVVFDECVIIDATGIALSLLCAQCLWELGRVWGAAL